MASNEERREIARRLRETGEELGSAALLWHHIAKALGVRTATDGKTACGMLADLIEPGAERTCSMDVTDADHGLYAVLECSECGRSCEEVNGCYRYCPHCGARVG